MTGHWVRRTSPVLAGVALVLMLHGDYVLSVLFALLFFIAYVGSDWRFLTGHRPTPEQAHEQAAADEEEHRDA